MHISWFGLVGDNKNCNFLFNELLNGEHFYIHFFKQAILTR